MLHSKHTSSMNTKLIVNRLVKVADSIGNEVVKSKKHPITPLLTKLFNRILAMGTFLQDGGKVYVLFTNQETCLSQIMTRAYLL